MQQNNSVSFFAPGFDDTIEQQKIERQRKLAESMMQQSQTPTKGQMVGNIYVPPSWTEGVANVAQAFLGGQMNRQADEKQSALAQAMQARNKQEMKDFFSTLRGTPGTPEQNVGSSAPRDLMYGEKNLDLTGQAAPDAIQPAQAAIPGDQNKAIEMAFNAKNPLVQGYGGQLATGQLQQQQMMDQLAAAMKAAGMGSPGGGQSGGGAPGAPTAGGSFGGVNPLAAALTMSGNSTLGKLGGMVADANKPIPMREGDLVRPNGQGGFSSVYQAPKLEAGIVPQRDANGQVTSAGAIPGYGAASADIQGAQAAAKAAAQAGQEMVTVNTPQGPRLMTKAQAVALSGGPGADGAPVAPPQLPPQGAQPAQTANPMAPRPEDKDRALIFTNELKAAQGRLATAKTPEETQRAQNDIAGLGREMKANGIAPAAGISLQDDGSKAFETKMGTEQGDMLTKSHAAATNAADEAMGIAEARKAVQSGVFQGSGANMKLGIAKFINANIPGVTVDPAKVGDSDYLKSLLGEGLLKQAKTLGGNPSNADAARINDIVGDLTKDPQAMQKILDWRQKMAERAIENHNLKVDQSIKNGFKPQFDMRVKSPTANADIDALLKKYGGK